MATTASALAAISFVRFSVPSFMISDLGDYLQLVRFINSLERDQMFFLVNSVVLGGEQGGVVKLELKMNTYLKTGPGTA